MADFAFNKKALSDLEKKVQQNLKKAEDEANKAAARESSLEGKARAFARVLRRHGVKRVDEAGLRKKFAK